MEAPEFRYFSFLMCIFNLLHEDYVLLGDTSKWGNSKYNENLLGKFLSPFCLENFCLGFQASLITQFWSSDKKKFFNVEWCRAFVAQNKILLDSKMRSVHPFLLWSNQKLNLKFKATPMIHICHPTQKIRVEWVYFSSVGRLRVRNMVPSSLLLPVVI